LENDYCSFALLGMLAKSPNFNLKDILFSEYSTNISAKEFIERIYAL
jgi:hypothetical protein